jgi:hypothetical protein
MVLSFERIFAKEGEGIVRTMQFPANLKAVKPRP